MTLRNINKKNVAAFIDELFDYYCLIDSNYEKVIYTKNSPRNNAGWYHYYQGKHLININIPNIMTLTSLINNKSFNNIDFYTFVAFIVGHEYRHFLQTRYAKEGVYYEGCHESDILADELVIYIKMFFDQYYLLNKGFIRFEEDAEAFAIKNTLSFFKDNYSNIDSEKALINVLNYYARMQERAGIISTIPLFFNGIDDVLNRIDERIKNSRRIPSLNATLDVKNPICYEVQKMFDLDKEKMLSKLMIARYESLDDGYMQDLLVAKKILSLISYPEKSLEAFPALKKIYKK